MNTILKIIIGVLVCLFTTFSGFAQSKTRKVIEDAMYNSQYKTVNFYNSKSIWDFSTHSEYVYKVSNCDVEIEDFNAFRRNNPLYVFSDVNTQDRLRFGFYDTFVKSFSFRNTNPEANTLEFAIRVSNHNPNLKMPSFHDVNEADAFYVKYVKPFEQLRKKYIEEFVETYTNYLRNNKDRIMTFCKKSPYLGVLFKEQMYNSWGIPYTGRNARIIDVSSVLNSALCEEDFVFYLESNYGYIYNNKNKYCGDIRKDKADGQGKLWDQTGTWEGSFKNGKKHGLMTHTWETQKYKTFTENQGKFDHEEKGNCVDGVWDGPVEYRVKDGSFNFTIADVEILHYNKGVLVRREQKDNTLTKAIQNHIDQYDNLEVLFASGKVRVPKVKRQENEDYNDSGYRIQLFFADGVVSSIQFYYDGTYEVYDSYHWMPVKENSYDRAARHAYVFEKYKHSDVEVVVQKYGLPEWE